MSVESTGPRLDPALIARVKNILLTPAVEWEVIEAETSTIGSLFTRYAVILAAIPALASVIGGLGGIHAFWFYYRPSPFTLIGNALVTYALNLGVVYVWGLVINAFAKAFEAEQSAVQAMKVAVYTMTPIWLAGVLQILPILNRLSILGLIYAGVLLYIGLPRLMKPSAGKQLGYFAAVGVVFLIAWSVINGSVWY